MRSALLLLFAFMCGVASAADEYTVRITSIPERVVHIEAFIHPASDTLLMCPFGAEHLEMGWATFVSGLEAFDARGAAIAVSTLPGGVFHLPGATNGVRLRYTVRIAHDQQHWPFGHKEAAYVRGELMMATGNALFITRLDLDTARIRFELPERYRLASAWRPDGPDAWVALGAQELVWTALQIGVFEQLEFPAGDMRVVLAFGPEVAASKDEIKAITARAIERYTELYGAPPRPSGNSPSTYLQVINVDTSYVGGGATFTNSISILLHAPPGRCEPPSTYCWHHIIVHELGHLWNGMSLMSDDTDQWFQEGFTDHMAWRVQHDLGLITDAQWRTVRQQKQEEAHAARTADSVALRDAGADKGRYYDLIYSGGFHFAEQLDSTLQQKTSGRTNLIHVLRQLYAVSAGTNTPLGRDDLQHTAEALCACSLKEVFARLDAME